MNLHFQFNICRLIIPLLVCLTFLQGFGLRAQTRKLPVVKVNLGGRTFEDALPFDEPFNITGKIDKITKKIILRYGAIDECKAKQYFSKTLNYQDDIIKKPDGTFYRYEDENIWINNGDEGDFLMGQIGSIRPNTRYYFNFITFKKFDSTPELTLSLKTAIFRELSLLTKDITSIDTPKINALFTTLNALPNQVYGTNIKIVDLDNKIIEIKPFVGPLAPISNGLIRLKDDVNSANEDIRDVKSSLDKCSDILGPIINILTNTDLFELSVVTQNTMKSAVDLSIANIGKTNLIDVLKVFNQLCINKNHLNAIIDGKLKINGLDLIISNGFDDASVQLIASALSILVNNKGLEYKEKGKKVINKIVDANQSVEIQKYIASLVNLSKAHKTLTGSNSELRELEKQMPDVFASAFIAQSFTIIESATIDVSSEKTPYISLDAGITGAFNGYKVNSSLYGNNVYIFTYQAANIHFTPVNKRVPSRDFKPSYRFLKSFSIQVGIAQLLGSYNSERFSNSMGGTGNLLVGAGYRLSRVTKVGLSTVFVNRANSNPSVSTNSLSPFFAFNFSFDMDVAKAFGSIGTALKLF